MADLCSLADVKGYLGLDAQGVLTQDDLLKRLISAASARIQSLIGRQLVQSDRTLTWSGDGTTYYRFVDGPVTAISSLSVDGATIAARTSTTEGWVLVDDQLYLSGPSGGGSGFVQAVPYSQQLSPTKISTLRFTVGNANVVVAYTAGYPSGSIPEDLKQATVVAAADSYNERNRLGVMSKGIAGESVTFQTISRNSFVQDVIDSYRSFRV